MTKLKLNIFSFCFIIDNIVCFTLYRININTQGFDSSNTMTLSAQFSPFAALTGHEEAIQETARLTDRRHEMDEESTRLLNERYHELLERFAEQPWISLTYFVPDDRKEGGKYVTVQSTVKKIKEYERQLVLADERIISMSDIVSMQFLDRP